VRLIVKPVIAFDCTCGHCGKRFEGAAELFSLAQKTWKKRCLCMKTTLEAAFNGGCLQLRLHCGDCGQTHETSMAPGPLLHGEVALIQCTQHGKSGCMAGIPSAVHRRQITRSVLQELSDRLLELQQGHAPGTLVQQALDAVRQAAHDGRLTCRCGSRHFAAAYDICEVRVVCKDCGAGVRLPAINRLDVQKISQKKIRLQKPLRN